MNDQNKAELRRLAEAATSSHGARRIEVDHNGVPVVLGDGSWRILSAWHTPDGKGMANASLAAACSPAAVLSLLDENDQLKAENAQRIRSLQHMIDQTIPLVPVPGDPMWSRRITIDELLSERDQLRAEVEALRGLLVQCALSAATLRADAPHYANHAGFNEQFTDAIRKASGVKIGHGVASPKYPSQEDAVAAMAKEGSANG